MHSVQKRLFAVLCAAMLLTGCTASSAAPEPESSDEVHLVTLSEKPEKSGEFSTKIFARLLFAADATAESLAADIDGLVIYPAGSGYQAVVPVDWKNPDSFVYEQFEITLDFDQSRALTAWSADSTKIRYDWLVRELGDFTAWDGTNADYTIEWATESGMYLLMHTATGSLRYSAAQSVPQSKVPQTDTGSIFQLKIGMEKARVFSLIGDPVREEESDGKTVCTWEFGSVFSVEKQGVLWSRTDELLPVIFTCVFTEGQLSAADYHIYGLLDSAAEEITKVLGRTFKSENPDGYFETTEGWGVKAVHSLNGDLTATVADKSYLLSWRPGDMPAETDTAGEQTDITTEQTETTSGEVTETETTTAA